MTFDQAQEIIVMLNQLQIETAVSLLGLLLVMAAVIWKNR